MTSEVVGGQRAAGGARGPRDPCGEPAAIERVAAAPGDLVEGRGEIGLHEALARQEVGAEDAPELCSELRGRLVAEEIGRVRGLPPLARRRGKALAGVDDRRVEQRAPRDRRAQRVAAQPVGRPPAGHDARDGQRRAAAAYGNGSAKTGAIGVEIGGRGRPTRRVQRAEPSVAGVVDEPEAVAPHAVHVRIDDGDRGAGGNGGVHGVAPSLEDRQSGIGSERVRGRDEPARGMGLGPSGRGGHRSSSHSDSSS